MQKLSFVYYYSENRATSRIWKVLPNMVFPPIWRKNGGACKLSWTLFSPARVQPLYGAGRKESSGTALPLSSYANFIFSLHKLKTKALVMCVRSKKTSVFFWLCFMITNMITERKNESEFLVFSPVEFCKNLSDVINNTKLQ